MPAGPLEIDPWLNALKHGYTFATNGPLLGFNLDGKEVGGDVHLPAGENKVRFKAWLRSFVPVDHLEIICNGNVVKGLNLSPDRQSSDAEGEITLSQSGWCLLRALSDKAEHPVLDAYPYATTSPIYVGIAGSQAKSPNDAAYFVAWIDRLIEAAKAHKDWNADTEKETVINQLHQARQIYSSETR